MMTQRVYSRLLTKTKAFFTVIQCFFFSFFHFQLITHFGLFDVIRKTT